MKNEVIKQFALLAVRHGLTMLGAAGAVSNDEISQIAGVAMILGGLVWSGWRKIQAARAAAQIPPMP